MTREEHYRHAQEILTGIAADLSAAPDAAKHKMFADGYVSALAALAQAHATLAAVPRDHAAGAS